MVNKLKCYRNAGTGTDISFWWVDGYKNTSDFYLLNIQSSDVPVPLLIMRGFMLSISCMILIWAICFQLTPLWFVYLTNWGLLALVALNLFGFIVSLMAVGKILPASIESGELPWYVKCFWLFSNVATTMCLVITALYFILLFDPMIVQELGWQGFWLDMCTHGVTSILVLIELVFSRTPVHIMHFYMPLCVGLWYAVFTAVFYIADGTVNGFPFIYEVLNWEYPKRTSIVVSLCALAMIIIYVGVWSLALARTMLAKTVTPTDVVFKMSETDPSYPEHLVRYL